MQILINILTLIVVFGLPAFLVYKLYRLLVITVNFNHEQKKAYNKLRFELMRMQLLKMQQEIDFYERCGKDRPGRSNNKGGDNYARDRKNNNKHARTAAE